MFEIKRLTIQDATMFAERAAGIYLEYFKYLWDDEGSNYAANSFGLKVLEEELKNPENLFFGAFLDGELIGFLKLRPDNSLPVFDKQNAFEIERIYLARESQGKGIGKSLMNFSIGIAEEMGKEVVWLKVMDSNKNSIRFYENFGFTECGTSILELPNVKDEFRGMLVMQKNIRS